MKLQVFQCHNLHWPTATDVLTFSLINDLKGAQPVPNTHKVKSPPPDKQLTLYVPILVCNILACSTVCQYVCVCVFIHIIMCACYNLSVLLPGPIIMICPDEGKENVPLLNQTDKKCCSLLIGHN